MDEPKRDKADDSHAAKFAARRQFDEWLAKERRKASDTGSP